MVSSITLFGSPGLPQLLVTRLSEWRRALRSAGNQSEPYLHASRICQLFFRRSKGGGRSDDRDSGRRPATVFVWLFAASLSVEAIGLAWFSRPRLLASDNFGLRPCLWLSRQKQSEPDIDRNRWFCGFLCEAQEGGWSGDRDSGRRPAAVALEELVCANVGLAPNPTHVCTESVRPVHCETCKVKTKFS